MNLVTECECIREWVQVTFIALSHRGVRSKKSTGDGHNADESLTYSLLFINGFKLHILPRILGWGHPF